MRNTMTGKHVTLGMFIHLSLGCWCCVSLHIQKLSARRLQEAQSADDRWKSWMSALEWKWCSLDGMATKRFKRLDGSEDPGTRYCPDASPPPQLKCSFHESAMSITGWEPGGRSGCFYQSSAACLPDNGRWECLDISWGLSTCLDMLCKVQQCHAPSLTLLPCINCECVPSLSLLG